jgi:hypothetical protein
VERLEELLGLTLSTLTCACGHLLDPTEGGKCAFCRMAERGDRRLISHSSGNPDCECGCADVVRDKAAA